MSKRTSNVAYFLVKNAYETLLQTKEARVSDAVEVSVDPAIALLKKALIQAEKEREQ